MLVYGHRGAPAEAPENTLSAFVRALELGVDGIELDLQATADRRPVVLHDRDLRRTTNGRGPVDRLSLAELRAFDAGNGERVPTFEEALELIGDRAHLDIEIKQGGIEAEVLNVLARHPRVRWAISSFDWTSLERIRAGSESAELWVLAVDVSAAALQTAKRLGATALALADRAFTAETAYELAEKELDAVIWTVNDVERASRLRELGATAVCTDDPAALLGYRRRS